MQPDTRPALDFGDPAALDASLSVGAVSPADIEAALPRLRAVLDEVR